MNSELTKYPPEIDQQIVWLKNQIRKTKLTIELHKKVDLTTTLEEDTLRNQKAILDSLCVAKWVVDSTTANLLALPGNQKPAEKTLEHTKCWIPYQQGRGWTIILVERGKSGFIAHDLGEVNTEAEAIDWADNQNYTDFQLEDAEAIKEIIRGTIHDKEVSHG